MKSTYRLAVPACLLHEQGRWQIRAARLEISGAEIVHVDAGEAEDLQHWQTEDADLEVHPHAFLTPAWINAHTHLAMSFFRQIAHGKTAAHNLVENLFFTVEKNLSPQDVYVFSKMGAYECLRNGIGLVWDHYYHGDSIARALRDTGLSGVVAPTLQDLAGPGKEQSQAALATTATLDSDSWQDSGVYAAVGPHATDTVSAPLWEQSLSLAQKHNLPLHFHLAQSWDEYQRCQERHRTSPVQWLQRLGVWDHAPHALTAHGLFLNETDVNQLAKKNITLGLCPFSQIQFAFPAAVEHWQSTGCRWSVGTDSVASNDSMNLQKELKLITHLPLAGIPQSSAFAQFFFGPKEKSADALQALRQQTWQNAETLRDPCVILDQALLAAGSMHPKLRIGKIAAGYQANLQLWDSRDPSLWPGPSLRALVYGDTLPALRELIVRGRRNCQDIDSQAYSATVDEANARLSELKRRCGLP